MIFIAGSSITVPSQVGPKEESSKTLSNKRCSAERSSDMLSLRRSSTLFACATRRNCRASSRALDKSLPTRTAELLSRMALSNSPRASGIASRMPTLVAPTDSPKIVTFLGSPPKLVMFWRTQRSAATWSRMPLLPLPAYSGPPISDSSRKPNGPSVSRVARATLDEGAAVNEHHDRAPLRVGGWGPHVHGETVFRLHGVVVLGGIDCHDLGTGRCEIECRPNAAPRLVFHRRAESP